MTRGKTGRRGLLLVNLGSPEAPEPAAVARFLKEFLGDRRVVEAPRLVWWFVLNGIIAPFRSRASAEKYRKVWWPEGSPLKVITERQAQGLQQLLDRRQPDTFQVRAAYTYGPPGIAESIEQLRAAGADSIRVLPLYPQYSATTTGSVVDQIARLLLRQRDTPALSWVRSYADHPAFIAALAASVRRHWEQHGRAERLLMSFHGIPQRCVDRGDPYQRECEATARALAAALQLEPQQWAISYQSRLGPAQWLEPATNGTLQDWGRAGLASVDVICPAFAADCLETLEEIELENREVFHAAGGGDYRYIPCLNDDPAHLEMMAELLCG